jgi:hypothetical protein
MPESGAKPSKLECPLAHDLLNKLSIVIGHCELLVEDTENDSRIKTRVLLLRDVAASMAQDLKQFQCELIQLRISQGKNGSVTI